MSTSTIGEAARRSGFRATALRFDEDIGLVDPVSRTDAGDRVDDDRALERLAFIAWAKQLGCSLEEITDHVRIRDGEHCGPVQRHCCACLSFTLVVDAGGTVLESGPPTSPPSSPPTSSALPPEPPGPCAQSVLVSSS